MIEDRESRDLEGAEHFAAADAEPPDRPSPDEYADLPILDLGEFDRETGEPAHPGQFDEHGREMLPCLVCGENMTPNGRACRRCQASMEEDRLNRESGR